MATNNGLKNQLSNTNNNEVSNTNQMSLKSLLSTPTMQKKFNEVLQEKSTGFMTSLLNLVNGDQNLAEAEPMSVVTSAMVAATLDLPIDKNLGYAWIVPFRDWKRNNIKVAQFQLGYKGYIQLAMRSGQYKGLNVTEVYEGELKSWNRLTEEIEFDPEGKTSDEVIGYVGYFKLINGFEKTTYWTKQEIESHRVKFNKAKNKTALTGVWASDYNAMANKTVLRNLLSKWGILSIEMQKAYTTDETVQEIDKSGNMIDVTDSFVNEETTEKLEANDDGEIIENNKEEQEKLFGIDGKPE